MYLYEDGGVWRVNGISLLLADGRIPPGAREMQALIDTYEELTLRARKAPEPVDDFLCKAEGFLDYRMRAIVDPKFAAELKAAGGLVRWEDITLIKSPTRPDVEDVPPS